MTVLVNGTCNGTLKGEDNGIANGKYNDNGNSSTVNGENPTETPTVKYNCNCDGKTSAVFFTIKITSLQRIENKVHGSNEKTKISRVKTK